MSKKSKNDIIITKRDVVVGIVVSFVFSLFLSYNIAGFIVEDTAEIPSFTGFLIPIFFVLFGMCILSFIVLSDIKKK